MPTGISEFSANIHFFNADNRDIRLLKWIGIVSESTKGPPLRKQRRPRWIEYPLFNGSWCSEYTFFNSKTVLKNALFRRPHQGEVRQGLHRPQRPNRLCEERRLPCKKSLRAVQHPGDHHKRQGYVSAHLWCDVFGGRIRSTRTEKTMNQIAIKLHLAADCDIIACKSYCGERS